MRENKVSLLFCIVCIFIFFLIVFAYSKRSVGTSADSNTTNAKDLFDANVEKMFKKEAEIQELVLSTRDGGLSLDEKLEIELRIEQARGNEVARGWWEIKKIDNTNNMYLAKLSYYINGIKHYKTALVNYAEMKVCENNF